MDISKIKGPSDIKNLSLGELKDIADQIRNAILNRTSKIGGHVSPNLGDVEAVIALHYVFDAPKDKIVFDVSHQDFAHKILTGRAYGYMDPKDFSKVGEYTDPKESPAYDLFYAGHTSPSISLCTGLMKARELTGDKFNIVAFIGDGSLSGGEAFEGLDAAGELKKNLIVVVNDNQMSIAEDHGGMYESLRLLRETNGTSERNIFKDFGFQYVYVADGNDLESLITALSSVKDSEVPVVVHINTQKGKGYEPAEEFREEFHQPDPFQIENGEPLKQTNAPNAGKMLRDWLLRKCKEEPRLLIVASATPESYGFYAKQREQAGKHYIDVGIAEQTAVSVMAGAAKGGAKVVYPVPVTFVQRAFDQLIEDWAMDESPALLIALKSGLTGETDLTHLGFWDVPMFSLMPNITYLAPTNIQEFFAMLEWGLKQDKYKVVVRMPTYSLENATGPVETDFSDLNKFKIVHSGKTVAVIAAGDYFVKGSKVCDLLKAQGIDATLINPRFVSGVDNEMIQSLKKDHELLVTIEDCSIEGGFGQKVATAAAEIGLRTKVFGLQKKFVDRYLPLDLEKEEGLLPEQITEEILKLLGKKSC